MGDTESKMTVDQARDVYRNMLASIVFDTDNRQTWIEALGPSITPSVENAITLRLLGWVGLYLVPTILAPDDQPHLGRRGVAERHRRAGIGFHRRRWRFNS